MTKIRKSDASAPTEDDPLASAEPVMDGAGSYTVPFAHATSVQGEVYSSANSSSATATLPQAPPRSSIAVATGDPIYRAASTPQPQQHRSQANRNHQDCEDCCSGQTCCWVTVIVVSVIFLCCILPFIIMMIAGAAAINHVGEAIDSMDDQFFNVDDNFYDTSGNFDYDTSGNYGN